MGFKNTRELLESCFIGDVHTGYFRKTPASLIAGQWMDLSMQPGMPVPNYYASAPLIARTMSFSNNNGMRVGGGVAPKTKHIARTTILDSSAFPWRLILCDYLLYYPFIDMGETEAQIMNNDIVLSRYTDGKGVMVMPVLTNLPTAVGTTFRITYTNHKGVQGKTSPEHRVHSASITSTVITAASVSNADTYNASPFIALAQGDEGVRKIESVQITGTYDVGLFCLVLIKPLATIIKPAAEAGCNEKCFLTDQTQLPKIEDDAYVNAIVTTGTTGALGLHGIIDTIWR